MFAIDIVMLIEYYSSVIVNSISTKDKSCAYYVCCKTVNITNEMRLILGLFVVVAVDVVVIVVVIECRWSFSEHNIPIAIFVLTNQIFVVLLFFFSGA